MKRLFPQTQRAKRIVAALLWAFIIVAALGEYLADLERANASALEHVKKHYEPSAAFHALRPDLPSGSWEVSSKFTHCPEHYHCAEVRYSFNVMQGAEVKRVVCVWQVQASAGEVMSAKPDNTEARELFRKSAP